MFQTKAAGEIKTHISVAQYFPENRAVYEVIWNKYGRAGQATDRNKIPRMRTACWIPKDKVTHSEYVILIAFPGQKLLRERATVLCSCTLPVTIYVKSVLSFMPATN